MKSKTLIAVISPVLACAGLLATAQQNGSEHKITVRMEKHRFVPDQITVKSGDTVEWVAEPDGPAHQVTTDPSEAMNPANVEVPKGVATFDSGRIKAGKSYSYQFKTPGLYRYTCPPHENDGMIGRVTVAP